MKSLEIVWVMGDDAFPGFRLDMAGGLATDLAVGLIRLVQVRKVRSLQN